jgi:hypothetical protein
LDFFEGWVDARSLGFRLLFVKPKLKQLKLPYESAEEVPLLLFLFFGHRESLQALPTGFHCIDAISVFQS